MSQKVPPAKAATREEIDAAIAALTETDLVRLFHFAEQRMVRIGNARDARDAHALLAEAYRRVLGSRSWNKDVPLLTHLFRTIRSVSSHWAQEFTRELKAGRDRISEDHDVRTDEALALKAAAVAPDAEREIIARDLFEFIKALFADDALAANIIAGWEEGLNGPAIRELLGVERKTFEAKVRAIRRRLSDEGLKPKKGH